MKLYEISSFSCPSQAQCTISKGYTGENKDELDDLWGGGEAVPNMVRHQLKLLEISSFSCPSQAQCTLSKGYTGEYKDELDGLWGGGKSVP